MKVYKKPVVKSLCAFLAMSILLFSDAGAAFAAPVKESKRGESIVREYVFYGDTLTNPEFSEIKKKIEVDGKKYILADTKFEKLGEAATVTRKVESKNKRDYPKSVKGTNYLGEEVTLTVDPGDIEWSEGGSGATETVTFENAGSIPEKRSVRKSGKEISMTKKSVKESSRNEAFTADAIFYGEKGATYRFNGKVVDLGDTPMWQGCEQDIKAHLNDSSIISITGASWRGGMTKDARGRNVRYATFSGTRRVLIYTVTYAEDAHYTAEITYTDPAETGKYVIKAVCTYDPDKTLMKAILYGAGVFVLAGAIAALIAYFATRKRIKKPVQ